MKMRSILSVMLGALASLTLFSSCSNNDETPDNPATAVRFTATIGKAEAIDKSRAADASWAGGDAIGIFMVNNGTATIAESANNKQHTTTTGTGVFTAAAGNEIYYPMDGSLVSFIAYYPHSSSVTLTTPVAIEIATTQTAANQSGFDLLYSAGATAYSKTSTGNVALTFGHKLARIVMNCGGNATVGVSLEGMEVTIKGMNTKNTFNFATGALGISGTKAPITARNITNGSVYDAIIMPDSYLAGDLTVEFKLSTGEIFTWVVDAVAFEGGNAYIYNVTLTRTGVSVTGSITPWEEIPRDPVTAE